MSDTSEKFLRDLALFKEMSDLWRAKVGRLPKGFKCAFQSLVSRYPDDIEEAIDTVARANLHRTRIRIPSEFSPEVR